MTGPKTRLASRPLGPDSLYAGEAAGKACATEGCPYCHGHRSPGQVGQDARVPSTGECGPSSCTTSHCQGNNQLPDMRPPPSSLTSPNSLETPSHRACFSRVRRPRLVSSGAGGRASRPRACPGLAGLGAWGRRVHRSSACLGSPPPGMLGAHVLASFLNCAIYCTVSATYLYIDTFSIRGISCSDTLCFIGLFL